MADVLGASRADCPSYIVDRMRSHGDTARTPNFLIHNSFRLFSIQVFFDAPWSGLPPPSSCIPTSREAVTYCFPFLVPRREPIVSSVRFLLFFVSTEWTHIKCNCYRRSTYLAYALNCTFFCLSLLSRGIASQHRLHVLAGTLLTAVSKLIPTLNLP